MKLEGEGALLSHPKIFVYAAGGWKKCKNWHHAQHLQLVGTVLNKYDNVVGIIFLEGLDRIVVVVCRRRQQIIVQSSPVTLL